MKKNILSLISILALSGASYAGGDIAPVEEPIVVAPVVIDNSAFYLGLGFGAAAVNDDFTSEEISNSTVMLQAG